MGLERHNLTRRNFMAAGGMGLASLLLAACSGDAESAEDTAASSNTGAITNLDPDYVPSAGVDFAILEGTWEEMGHQLAQQYPDAMRAGINVSVGNLVKQLGSYDALVEAYKPTKELYDKLFHDDVDGNFSDMAKGIADELGLDYWQAAASFFPDSPDGEVGTDEAAAEDEKSCSACVAWGEATADGLTGCISIMDADIDINELHYIPTYLAKPNNGYWFMSMDGLFGSVANDQGLAIQSPGGSSNLPPKRGTHPHPWLAAYCATAQEAADFMGDPEGDPETWVPLVSDYNMVMCDATGDCFDYQCNNVARWIRRNGDTKVLSPTPGDVMPDETSTYLLTNNLYLSEPMLDNVLSNVRVGLDYWDDVEPRYWTVDKILSDAAGNGGITIDTLVEAENEIRYYIPDDFNYDFFPEVWGGFGFGFWVPSAIYEQLDEEGGLTRAEYYGELYNPEEWGAPMDKDESRKVEAWAPGWHKPSWSATPKVSTMGYWSPTPVSDVDKNGSRNVFDSNTKTVYFLNGSANRLLSNFPDAAGTHSIVRFYSGEAAVDDVPYEIVSSAIADLKEQLWLAARDLERRGVKLDTANGKVLEDYVDQGKEALYRGINYQAQAVTLPTRDEQLKAYAHALTILTTGMTYVQLAQDEPGKLIKDFGEPMIDVKNLEN